MNTKKCLIIFVTFKTTDSKHSILLSKNITLTLVLIMLYQRAGSSIQLNESKVLAHKKLKHTQVHKGVWYNII